MKQFLTEMQVIDADVRRIRSEIVTLRAALSAILTRQDAWRIVIAAENEFRRAQSMEAMLRAIENTLNGFDA